MKRGVRGRDRLGWSVARGKSGDGAIIQLCATDRVAGVTLEFQRTILGADGRAAILPDKRRVVLPELQAGEQITLHVRYAHR